MAEGPTRKRATPASRDASATTRTRSRRRDSTNTDDAVTNYGLRLTEGIESDPPVTSRGTNRRQAPKANDSFALRLTQAVEAISAAQSTGPVEAQPARPRWVSGWRALPPIRLPIGPPVPWRIGAPVLVILLVLIVVASRSASPADTNGLQLASQTQTVGLSDATANANVDLLDIGVKTAAVLGIAYASLMLLKRFGVGGSNAAASTQVLRVVGSVALAPNRSVHAIELPGGRTLLVGATPSSINLLGELNGS